MTPHFDRAMVLLNQNRNDLAEVELRKHLSAASGDPVGHAMLALCLSAQEKSEPALAEAKAAVGAAPAMPFAHYALARVFFHMDRYAEAERALDEAIRLDPDEADHFSLRSNIRLQRSDWAGALEAADEALRHDPTHATAANLRGMALVKLGRKREAEATLKDILAQDPENALSHANQGWTQLERNDPAKAQVHFREALRIDPTLDWARAGMVEALKARNPIYRVLLQYFLWMAKLSDKAQIIVIVALVVGRRLLGAIGRSFPEARPFVYPLIGLIIGFCYLTWVAQPLFNLSLRLNKFGWYALTKDQRRASTWVGFCYLGALLSGLYWLGAWILGLPGILLAGLLTLGLLIIVIPISATYGVEGVKRTILGAVTIGLAALLVLALISQVVAPGDGGLETPGDGTFLFGLLFMIGAAASTWIGFFLGQKE
jgi:tetratricopeptide (TPR) repeat protein